MAFDHPGLIFGLFGLVVVVVRTVGRRLPDRLGARPTLTLSFASLAVGLATIGLWNHAAGLLVGTAIFAVGQALVYPAAALLALESAAPAERSAVLGSVGAAVDVALGFGAFVLGALAETTGYAEAFLVTASVPLLGLVLLVSLRISGRMQPASLEEGAP